MKFFKYFTFKIKAVDPDPDLYPFSKPLSRIRIHKKWMWIRTPDFNPQTFFLKLSEVMVGSGIRKKPIPVPGVQKAMDPGSATLLRSSLVSFSVLRV